MNVLVVHDPIFDMTPGELLLGLIVIIVVLAIVYFAFGLIRR